MRSFPAFTVGPCLYFHFAGGDKGFKVQQAVNGFNQSVAATFFQAEVFEEHLFLFVSFQFGNVGFGLGGDYDELGIFTLNGLTYLLHILIAACGACIVHVADVKYRFGGKQEHLFGALLLIIVLWYYGAGALSLFQCIFVTEQEFVFHFCQFVATYFCYFFHALDAVFYCIEVFELEFGINDFLVAYRIHASVHVNDIAIIETTQHMNNGVALADVA